MPFHLAAEVTEWHQNVVHVMRVWRKFTDWHTSHRYTQRFSSFTDSRATPSEWFLYHINVRLRYLSDSQGWLKRLHVIVAGSNGVNRLRTAYRTNEHCHRRRTQLMLPSCRPTRRIDWLVNLHRYTPSPCSYISQREFTNLQKIITLGLNMRTRRVPKGASPPSRDQSFKSAPSKIAVNGVYY